VEIRLFDYFVINQLLDSAAIAFTRAFYISLAVGNTVQESFKIGQNAVTSLNIPNSSNEGQRNIDLSIVNPCES